MDFDLEVDTQESFYDSYVQTADVVGSPYDPSRAANVFHCTEVDAPAGDAPHLVVKVFKAVREMRELERKRAEREVELLYALAGNVAHNYMVEVEAAFIDAGVLRLVMPLYPQTALALAQSWQTAGGYTDVELKQLATCCLRGLDFLHTCGITHRDVKYAAQKA